MATEQRRFLLKQRFLHPFPFSALKRRTDRPIRANFEPLRGENAMILQTPSRLTTPIVTGPSAVRLRPDATPRPVESNQAAERARPQLPGEQAAVLHFGNQALSLALGRQEPAEGSEEADVADEASGDESLSRDDEQALSALRQRDREVRAHEQTHRSVGGQYAGSIHLDYQVGPDGERYAVAGSTPIDVAPVQGDPAATLRKMEIVHRAATAPASPSGADHRVAAEATQGARRARAELAAERYERAHELARGGSEAPTESIPPGAARPPARADAPPGGLLGISA